MHLEPKWRVLIVVNTGIFMSTLDGSILNIANPTIAESLSVSLSQIQWLVTSYMLVITATLLFFGKLGDRKGRHKIYTYGFLIFVLGSLLCSFARVLSLLIGARIIQAFGASMMMATGMGIVSTTFPANERGKALGLTASMVGIGNMTGPSLGGILVENFSWPVIFLINVPIGLTGFYLANKFLISPFNTDTEDNNSDILGTLLMALALILFLFSISKSGEINIAFLIISIVLFAIFIYTERKTPDPLLDFELFKNPNFVAGNILAFIAYSSQTFIIFLLPFYFENILKLSPANSGLLMTIPPVLMALTAPFAGNLSDRLGAVPLTSASFILLTGAHLMLSRSVLTLNLETAILSLIILGAGMGSFGSPNNSSILGSVPPQKSGYTGGFISTVRNFSFSLGISFSVSIFIYLLNRYQINMSYHKAYTKSLHYVYLISASLNLLGVILSIYTRKYRNIFWTTAKSEKSS
ncbi:MFS transporter [Thermosyntropha sp.]|uniref:MFS transporter n=1 Tax=Thermosyntropha sp. TaxID=2740820 RepID=UPI0025EF4BBF|nr:MFS transporter [Thermosyntropha sp.]MBO8158340.1 MFS transporter [Thermosyntropha sp.]